MNNNYLKEQLSKLNENTTLKDLQKYVNDMIEIRGFSKETPQDVMLLLAEEVGELAKEIRKSRKYYLDTNKNNELDVEGEIADVFIYILSMCRVMNVNLLEAFKNKEEKNCKREWK